MKIIRTKLHKLAAIQLPYDPEWERATSLPQPPSIQEELNSNNPYAYGSPEEKKRFNEIHAAAEKRAELIVRHYKRFIETAFNEIVGNSKPTRYLYGKTSWDICREIVEAENLSHAGFGDSPESTLVHELGWRIQREIDQLWKSKTGFNPADASTNHLLSGDHADDRFYSGNP